MAVVARDEDQRVGELGRGRRRSPASGSPAPGRAGSGRTAAPACGRAARRARSISVRCRSRSPRRGPLGQREEREDERDDDPAQHERQAVRAAAWLGPRHGSGAGRRATASPTPATRPRKEWRLGAGALVDGHPYSPIAKRRRGVRGSRKANGSGWRRSPRARRSRGPRPPGCGAANSRSCSSCWRRPYERRRLDWWRLLTLASSFPFLPWTRPAAVRRRGARRPAGGRSGRGGWRRSRRPSGSATAGSRGAAGGSGRRRRPAAPAGRCSPGARRRGSA